MINWVLHHRSFSRLKPRWYIIFMKSPAYDYNTFGKPMILLELQNKLDIPFCTKFSIYSAINSKLKPNEYLNLGIKKSDKTLEEKRGKQDHKNEKSIKKELLKSVLKTSNQRNSHVTSFLLEPETLEIATKIPKTIVNDYSRVPSLPRYPQYELSISIPEEPSSEDVPSAIQRYFLGRFTKYLKKFQQSLSNEMPDTFHMFNTFTNGLKEFVIDFRDYITVIIKLGSPFYDTEDLSRRELELSYNMPRQMIRVFPVVAISSLPFAQNFALPIAYMVPKHLLCYHFWDTKQRQQFSTDFLRKRLFNARPVFRSLQSRIDEVQDPSLKRKCQSIFFSLGSGVNPTLEQILEVKNLFAGEPYHLDLLWAQHVNGLLRLYNRSALLRRRKRLKEHARYLHCMDKALTREGVDLLTSEQLWNMLILRGINPSGMSDVQKRDFLEKWIHVSNQVNEKNYSLLLHLPILLAYNHPTNLLLIYS